MECGSPKRVPLKGFSIAEEASSRVMTFWVAAAGGLVQKGDLEGAVTVGLVLCADIGIQSQICVFQLIQGLFSFPVPQRERSFPQGFQGRNQN